MQFHLVLADFLDPKFTETLSYFAGCLICFGIGGFFCYSAYQGWTELFEEGGGLGGAFGKLIHSIGGESGTRVFMWLLGGIFSLIGLRILIAAIGRLGSP